MLDDKLFGPSSADVRGKADLKELPFIGPFVLRHLPDGRKREVTAEIDGFTICKMLQH